MRSAIRGSIVIVACATASGCAVYTVRNSSGAVAGIPFYKKVGACLHETVRLQNLYRIAIQIVGPAPENKPVLARERVITQAEYQGGNMQKLRAEVVAGTKTYNEIVTTFESLAAYVPSANPVTVVASNGVTPAAIIDYATLHHVNVKRPWIGSATATVKLASDGTLTETTATIEDKTVETILGTLPIKEVLTARLVPTDPTRTLSRDPNPSYELVVEPIVIRYTLTKTVAMTSPICPPAAALEVNATDANIKIDKVDSPKEKPKDPNTVTVSGEIVLPKK
jgi:hypothetical protein